MSKKNIDFSGEKYKFLVENSPDVLLQTTKTGKLIYMSPNVETVYGYKLEEVVGRHFRNFVPAKEMPRYLLKMREMIAGKIVIGFNTFAKHKDGHLIPVELSGKFIKFGKKSYFNAVMRDISEKVDTEKALKESELQRKFILDTIPDLLFIINNKGIFKSYHGNIKNLYQPPEIFINQNLEKVLPTNVAIKTKKFLNKALKTKKIQIFEYFLEINNKKRWFEARMLAIKKNEIISIVREITSLKEQQEELLKNKEYLQTLFNSASEIIFTISLDKKFLMWNEAAKRISGYNINEVGNKKFDKKKLINNYIKFDSYLSNIIENEIIKTFEINVKTKYNTDRIWVASPSIIYSKSKDLSEILFICKDVTSERNTTLDVVFGRSYLLFDQSYQKLLNVIKNYLEKKYKIIFISRNINQEINKFSKNSKFEIINFSSKNQINNINNPDLLFTIIKRKIKTNSIIFIDRLDYLFNQYDFKKIISKFYNINDIIIKNNSMLIIRINPDLLSNKELIALKEEFYNYPHQKINEINIDKDLYDILIFINSKNKNNIFVTYKDIGDEFSISKITVAKKIENLFDKNLIYTHKKGRNKILELTNLAKDIISS